MSLQQGDVKLFQTENDGDIESINGLVTMTCGFETMVYISMFGGAGWWGDLDETDPDFRHPSETEQVLESVALIPANLRRIEEAALRDLAVFKNKKIANTVEVTASIPALNTLSLVIRIEAKGEISEFEFVENWNCEGAAARTIIPDEDPTIPAVARPWTQQGTLTLSADVGPYTLAADSLSGSTYVATRDIVNGFPVSAPEFIFKRDSDAAPWGAISSGFPGSTTAASLSAGSGGLLWAASFDQEPYIYDGAAWSAGPTHTGPTSYFNLVSANANTGDVYFTVVDTSGPTYSLEYLAAGAGPYIPIAGYPGTLPAPAVDHSDDSLVVLDPTSGDLYRYDGAWALIANVSALGFVQQPIVGKNGDIVLFALINGGTEQALYVLRGGVLPIERIETEPEFEYPISVAANYITGAIYTGDSNLVGNGTPPATREVYKHS